ncbi:MAG: DUF3047 domain-containing protein [Candidatus Omnitrophica bacterium]|nr:DUF3047 domain-containing protein [Candidatus Omnitrophota bacterium]MCM8790160.1 DUF3047 domain-containing protein [Candidatus Omnitrophota bacterium]
MKRRKLAGVAGVSAAFVIMALLAMAMYFTSARKKEPVATIVEKKVEAEIVKKPALPLHIVKWFPFSEKDSLKEWEEKIFKGRVLYKVEKSGDLSYVRARSDAAASALYYRIKLDARNNKPALTWKWRVDKFPEKKAPESLETEKEDDFAARVYVIFPAAFITNYKVLEYVWAEKLPVGTTGTSPYSKNIKLMVLRSGLAADGVWSLEERDIVADYKRMFGTSPEKDIGAVAFMTNTEHTGTSAEATYDEIRLGYIDRK